jgi:hypothetical protein
MPKIHFHGVDYETPDDMPADVRESYDKAVRMLPDRDGNGIPDLLESESKPVDPLNATMVDLIGKVSGDVGRQIQPQQAQKVVDLAKKGFKWGRLIYFGAMLLVLACVALSFLGIISLIKSSGSYRLAVETAAANPTIQEVLGAPIHDGLMPSGSTSESGTDGTADFRIPMSGSRQSGTLVVTAIKEENTWRLQSMVLEAGGQNYTIR